MSPSVFFRVACLNAHRARLHCRRCRFPNAPLPELGCRPIDKPGAADRVIAFLQVGLNRSSSNAAFDVWELVKRTIRWPPVTIDSLAHMGEEPVIRGESYGMKVNHLV